MTYSDAGVLRVRFPLWSFSFFRLVSNFAMCCLCYQLVNLNLQSIFSWVSSFSWWCGLLGKMDFKFGEGVAV